MEKRYDGREKIGDIVAEFPGASNLFKEAQIDFCCGGDRTLLSVIGQKGLDEAGIIRRLNDSYDAMINHGINAEKDWREVPVPQLIHHIVNAHHAYLKEELPLLSEFITKILRVHGPTQGTVLTDLHKKFHQMKAELEQHLAAEEEELFPLLQQYAEQPEAARNEQVLKGLYELESDHSEVGDALRDIRELTSDYALPPEACRTYQLTFQKLIDLESDMFQHIHLENNILFPRIEALSK
ncbi:Iron-sulfur cluster repair protein YtfE [Paenibacillus plantiphilus]|uniref:Iron-sulfur cluster repair protein YtfE n=1 Tax=Paenibacillus plantiphilus TaxID=2905650 RepID=A0ABN8GGM8_9BACL|nr:iron-sulfur cluster repair di-iron protein [Paenibacillus plantiphilus]CAH1208683.1 Iron-sulfur cluster repair protein YtfE [Paenibacillus plantiphilus]